jgi:hypothetical protein
MVTAHGFKSQFFRSNVVQQRAARSAMDPRRPCNGMIVVTYDVSFWAKTATGVSVCTMLSVFLFFPGTFPLIKNSSMLSSNVPVQLLQQAAQRNAVWGLFRSLLLFSLPVQCISNRVFLRQCVEFLVRLICLL